MGEPVEKQSIGRKRGRWLRLRAFCRWFCWAMLSLFVSFGLVYGFSGWIYLPDSDRYYGEGLAEDVAGQLEYFYWIWEDEERCRQAHAVMHEQNPEWDLVSRTFLAYSLANVAIKYPEQRGRALACMDKVIESTVETPWEEFLLDYAWDRPFVRRPARSLMYDGEVSLMIGLRRLVEDSEDYKFRSVHEELVSHCVGAIEDGPRMCGESYPNECWLFCTPLALASIKVYDVLEGEDHGELFKRWEVEARRSLIKPEVGLFYPAVTLSGKEIHPPEGSTIWIGAYCLEPVLPELAREQYERMKEILSGKLACFRYGREWPVGCVGEWDIDSGFTPRGMGPASTGFALVASKEFGDRRTFAELLGLLDFCGVPGADEGRYRYRSANLVGNAVFLLGKTTGPAWDELERRSRLGGGE